MNKLEKQQGKRSAVKRLVSYYKRRLGKDIFCIMILGPCFLSIIDVSVAVGCFVGLVLSVFIMLPLLEKYGS